MEHKDHTLIIEQIGQLSCIPDQPLASGEQEEESKFIAVYWQKVKGERDLIELEWPQKTIYEKRGMLQSVL